MRDALLLVDIVNDFEHEDGEELPASFRERHAGFVQRVALEYFEAFVGVVIDRR